MVGVAPMRQIAVACEDDRGLEGQVSQHFGRCPYFTVVEVEGDTVKGYRVVANEHFGNHRPGVMPGYIKSLGADVILAGGMGPRAVAMFNNLGLDVVTGAGGTVRQVVEVYVSGQLKGIVPCNHDHPESCGGHGETHAPPPAAPGGARAQPPAGDLDVKRIGVPAASDDGLAAKMDPRFGRAPFFAIVDGDDRVEFLPNTAVDAAHGAGTQAARLMAEQRVSVVVAGRFGPKAQQALQAFGIELVSAPEGGTVGDVVERLRAGQLGS